MTTRLRFPLLFSGALALAAGLWAGLARLGYALPGSGRLAYVHGPLMVCGFLGTVIALERAVALRKAWGFLAPAFVALGALALVAGAPPALPALLATLASVVVLTIFVVVLRSERALHHVVMTVGVVAWLAGNVQWVLGRPLFEIVGSWLVFLVLTIAGERLELRRVLPPARGARALFLVGVWLLVAGAGLAAASPDVGLRVLGAGELVLAAWLAHFDVARRTVRIAGLPRFVATCLLAGYGWLAFGGALALAYGNPLAGPLYDAVLHAVFVGFVFSMIFGHAPVIVPAVLGVRIDFRRRFYLHLAWLHAALAVRVVGDLAGVVELRRAGGLAGALAIVVFLVSTAAAARRPALPARPAGAAPPRSHP